MKKLILFIPFLFSIPLMAELPVFTFSHELGTRFEYDLTEDENLDYLILDSYAFNKGYAQIDQKITKALSFKFNFRYSLKSYEISTNLDNNSFYYLAAFGWEIIKNLDLDLGFRWTTRDFYKDPSGNIKGMAPQLELRFSPVKLLHFGLSYNLLKENYLSANSDYLGNRFNIWYEQRIIPSINLRLRYHFENRDFLNNSPQRIDSFKHSFSATLKIDLNKPAKAKLETESPAE